MPFHSPFFLLPDPKSWDESAEGGQDNKVGPNKATATWHHIKSAIKKKQRNKAERLEHIKPNNCQKSNVTTFTKIKISKSEAKTVSKCWPKREKDNRT